jgi:hypothetical protein
LPRGPGTHGYGVASQTREARIRIAASHPERCARPETGACRVRFRRPSFAARHSPPSAAAPPRRRTS